MQRSPGGRRWSGRKDDTDEPSEEVDEIMKIGARSNGGRTNRWPLLEPPRQRPGTHRPNLLKGRPWHVLEAPTGELPAVDAEEAMGPQLPDEATVNFVLDLSLRIGEVQMASGAGASDVTATIIAIAGALGLPHCEVDVIFTSITVT